MARLEIDRLRRVTLSLVALYYAAAMLLAGLSGLAIDYLSFFPFVGGCVVFVTIFSLYCPLRGMTRLGEAGGTATIMAFLAPPVLVVTYLSVKVGMPPADRLLSRLDASLGFDWLALVAAVDAQPGLSALLSFAYQTFFAQLILIPFLLRIFAQTARAYRFCIGYIAVCAVSSALSIGFPAIGTYASSGAQLTDLKHIDTFYGFFFLDQFNGVRDDPLFVLSLDRVAGILTFPSVHAGVAGLCLWGGWALPGLRYPIALLNVLMTLSAITHGSHYLVDVIAGLLIAVVSILCVRRLARPSPAGQRVGFGLAAPRAIRQGSRV